MKKVSYATKINAPREKVWEVLWGAETYPQWTAAFSPGSRAESDWQEGSKVIFLNEKNEGMISRIAQRREAEFMSFEHLGVRDKDGNENYESPEMKDWAGIRENYLLLDENGKTNLQVETEIPENYLDYFNKTWPIALEKLKEISERE